MRSVDVDDLGPKDLFLGSLTRCDRNGTFVEQFYERFMASPEVREKFVTTDFARQRRMLRRSLELMARASAGEPDGLRELNDRAETHSRANLNIEPRLYGIWLDSLIETARRSDPEWTPTVELAWREILGIAIRHMIKAYGD